MSSPCTEAIHSLFFSILSFPWRLLDKHMDCMKMIWPFGIIEEQWDASKIWILWDLSCFMLCCRGHKFILKCLAPNCYFRLHINIPCQYQRANEVWALIFQQGTKNLLLSLVQCSLKGEERCSMFFEMHNSMLDESIDLHHYYKCSMAAQTTEMIC